MIFIIHNLNSGFKCYIAIPFTPGISGEEFCKYFSFYFRSGSKVFKEGMFCKLPGQNNLADNDSWYEIEDEIFLSGLQDYQRHLFSFFVNKNSFFKRLRVWFKNSCSIQNIFNFLYRRNTDSTFTKDLVFASWSEKN